MLIARAPVRISFGGGGTDLQPYYDRFGGLVISASIDKYIYMMLSPVDNDTVQIISADYRTFHRSSKSAVSTETELPLPKAILEHFGLRHGLHVFLASEIPPGSGLGSSGAVAVAMIKGLSTLLERPMSRYEVAELAAYVEVEKLQAPVGKQDQYAAAFGGINAITLTAEGVEVEPLAVASSTIQELERGLMLFFMGSTRQSSSILAEQRQATAGDPVVIDALHHIKELAVEARRCLEEGDVPAFAEALHVGWEYKKRLATNVSNPFIDECYDLARRHGALGGKIPGAGGGGFMALYCPVPEQPEVIRVLEAQGLRKLDFRFDFHGARVLLNTSPWYGLISK